MVLRLVGEAQSIIQFQLKILFLFCSGDQQIRNVEAKNNKKLSLSSLTRMLLLTFCRDMGSVDGLQHGKDMNVSFVTQIKDMVITKPAMRKRETKDLDTLRFGILHLDNWTI